MPTVSDATVSLLLGSAASLATLHTLIGVDHSIPFIVLGRARGWSLRRTLGVTGACGLVHVASSVLIGFVGVALGIALERLSWLDSVRGNLAAALLIGFGLAYACWAAVRSLRGRVHTHVHTHADGTTHSHPHDHAGDHLHVHGIGRGVTPSQPVAEIPLHSTGAAWLRPGLRATRGSTTGCWILFLIFAFGPCEALIPLMMAPAVEGAWWLLGAVVAVFGVCTVGAMLAAVALGHAGLTRTRLGVLEQRVDVLAGLTVAASGAAVLFLGI